MNKSREMMAIIVGTVIGGVAGYLFFTDRGRRVRRQIQPALEDFSRELMRLRNTVSEVAGVTNEGWMLWNDTLGEGKVPPARYPGGQTSTF